MSAAQQQDKQTRTLARGALIHLAGSEGHAWRVVSGSVRLDHEGEDGPQFGGLALTGDVIGAETLLFGRYTFSARALSPCVLECWSEEAGETQKERLLHMLAAAERRMADILALRSGKAGQRVRGLLALLSRSLGGRRSEKGVMLPRLSDIAEITDLTVETVSRTISRLDSEGSLEVEGRSRSRRIGLVESPL